MATLVERRQTYALTPQERTLLEEFRKLDSRQQGVLLNALRHLASGAPGARLVLAVDR